MPTTARSEFAANGILGGTGYIKQSKDDKIRQAPLAKTGAATKNRSAIKRIVPCRHPAETAPLAVRAGSRRDGRAIALGTLPGLDQAHV